MAASKSELNTLIDAIYASIRSPHTWPDVIRQIGDALDADCGMMLSPSLPGIPLVPLVAYGLDLTPVMENLPAHGGRSLFTERALATGRAPGVFTLDELMPAEERPTNAFWQAIVAPLGIVSGILSVVRTPEDNQRPVIIGYYRRSGKPLFQQEDVAAAEDLLPHLRRALGITLDAPPAPSATAPDSMAEIYDTIGAPCFLFGSDGQIIHKNRAADLLLQAKDGVEVRGQRLMLWDSAAQAQLDIALTRVIGEAWSIRFRTAAELVAQRPSGGVPLVLVTTPIGAENPISAWATPVRCVVFVLEEKLRTSSMLTDRLTRLYGFTGAEAQIVIGLAGGSSITELARERGTKLDTVRTQVKSALSKSGARKQAELVALVNRLRF